MGSFSIYHWIILGVIAYLIYSAFGRSSNTGPMVCKSCGMLAKPRSAVSGNLAIEIILWLCFIIPGLIYSIWRGSTRHLVCSSCGSREVIPENSPMGQKVLKELSSK